MIVVVLLSLVRRRRRRIRQPLWCVGIRYHTQQRDHRETEKNLVGEIKYSTKIRKGLVLVIFLVLSILFLTLLSVLCTSSTYAQSGDPLVLTDYLSNPEMARSIQYLTTCLTTKL